MNKKNIMSAREMDQVEILMRAALKMYGPNAVARALLNVTTEGYDEEMQSVFRGLPESSAPVQSWQGVCYSLIQAADFVDRVGIEQARKRNAEAFVMLPPDRSLN